MSDHATDKHSEKATNCPVVERPPNAKVGLLVQCVHMVGYLEEIEGCYHGIKYLYK